MTEVRDENVDAGAVPHSRVGRAIQIVGALVATGAVLWFLFGIPVYILFGSLFD